MIGTQIAILAELARQDGFIDTKEKELIVKIGAAHGMTLEQVEAAMEHPIQKDFSLLSFEERFDLLYHIVQLMKVDGHVFDEEILYCMGIAKKLGFPLEAFMELYGHAHANVKITSELNRIKAKYIKRD